MPCKRTKNLVSVILKGGMSRLYPCSLEWRLFRPVSYEMKGKGVCTHQLYPSHIWFKVLSHYHVEENPVRVSRVLFETEGEDGFSSGKRTFDGFWTNTKPKLLAQIFDIRQQNQHLYEINWQETFCEDTMFVWISNYRW